MSKYHYHKPSQMLPVLPGEEAKNGLRPLAAELISKAKDLAAQGMPHLRSLLRETLRPMNSYYTNKIEGQHTEPILIEQAMAREFSSQPDEARKQRIAVAHIETERWGEVAYSKFDAKAFFAPETPCQIHDHLHQQLTDTDLTQIGDDGQSERIEPGQWRTKGVKVGEHIPPDPATVPQFMDKWHEALMSESAGENAVIALIAAHHRLAWIHPFTDGNGRAARLHTHLGLAALGLTQGLWSPMRGLARAQQDYYSHLKLADQHRHGDLDGRGNLSEKGLVAFIRFFSSICLDQIAFMESMLNLAALETRLRQMLAAESIKPEFKSLNPQAAVPLVYLTNVASMERTLFKNMLGLTPRTADRVLADLFKLGIITSKSPKGPVELALPLSQFRYLFPRLWPEAEGNV